MFEDHARPDPDAMAHRMGNVADDIFMRAARQIGYTTEQMAAFLQRHRHAESLVKFNREIARVIETTPSFSEARYAGFAAALTLIERECGHLYCRMYSTGGKFCLTFERGN